MKSILLSRLFAFLIFSTMVFSTMNAQNPMCMIGTATRYLNDKDKSSPLTQDGVNPSKFYYKAYLNAGDFKFLMQNSDWVPSWNKGASETLVVKRTSYADLVDEKFTVSTAGNYAIVLDTTALTLSVTPMTETIPIPFNTLFMVGNAAPNGWDLGKATELARNPTNQLEFSYTGALTVGEIKFPVNRNWGWNQDFFVKSSDVLMQLVAGGDVKWSIAEAGNYKITLNANTLAISIVKQTSAVNEVSNNEYPSLLANVVKEQLTVTNNTGFNYQIFNKVGASVLAGNSTNGIISVSNINNGIYFLKAKNKTFKFIKN